MPRVALRGAAKSCPAENPWKWWAAVAATVLIGTGLGLHALRSPKPDSDYVQSRLAAITTALAAAPRDAVLLVGNSHAALAAMAAPACTAWINAGIGGADARGYAALLDRLPAGPPIRVGVLLLGTNELVRRRHPLAPKIQTRFRADAARVLAWLQARAARVVVVAVPPIGATATDLRDPAAVAVYSDLLAGLCRSPACRFVDPFTGLRAGDGLARDGALPDGVHLADYPALLEALDLCR